jgi:hypothetical protein
VPAGAATLADTNHNATEGGRIMATNSIPFKYNFSKEQGLNYLAVWLLEKQGRLKPSEKEIQRTISDIATIPNIKHLEFKNITYTEMKSVVTFLCFIYGVDCDGSSV